MRDFRNLEIQLTDEALKHISEDHPDISIAEVELTLIDPDEVRMSKFKNPNSKCTAELYYRQKSVDPARFITVVVKLCPDGNFLKTGYTGNTLKDGAIVYRKGVST